MSPGPSAHFPPLSGGRTADTVRPSDVPLLGGHQCGRRFTKVLTEHGWPVALKPPHERGVVGCHPFDAPERFKLREEQPQLAAQRGMRGLLAPIKVCY